MTDTESAPNIVVDSSTEFGARVAARLDRERIVWPTTVDGGGTPQPSPVWFRRHDGAFLIFSRPNRPKIRNIRRNSRVSLHFNSTEIGGDICVFTGTARVEDAGVDQAEVDAYLDKYTERLASLSMTREQFLSDYSLPLRIIPDRLRGF